MADVRVETEGVEDLLRTLQRLHPSLAENGLRQGVNAVGREIVKQSRQNLAGHRRTGRLSKSLGTSTRIDRRTRAVTGKARTRDDGFYGRFLEFGTRHIRPVAWMRRAAESVTPRANDVIAAQVRKNMSKIVARARKKGLI